MLPHAPKRKRARAQRSTRSVPRHHQVTLQPLGGSDLTVSNVTLGTMTFGEQTPEAEAHRMLSFAAEAGVNFIDTAELYPVAPRRETAGATSRIVGSWLKGRGRPRDELVVASKVAGRSGGLEWVPANRTEPRGEERCPVLDGPSIVAACEGELRRLGTDYIDVLYLHWPDRWIRYWALSNETSFGVCMYCMVADAMGVDRPIAIQNSFSLVHRTFEGELAETCSPRHFNLPLLPWSALAGGALRYARFTAPRVRKAAARYAEIAADCGLAPAQLAYAWAASRPFVGSTLVGASCLEQLAGNLRFTGVELGPDVLAAVDEVHLRRRNPSLVD
ncbi:MAG: NADP-dependent oxidoreductase domain-containing protein [Monoraphidium minutum]|nr:MAG: NADP-dependent oxidoreductase domain-containing protein [Monoraphidium minutum]